MSWETINEMLALAAIDPDFCQKLLQHPLETAQQWNFRLTYKEQEALSQMSATSLAELSQQIIEKLSSVRNKHDRMEKSDDSLTKGRTTA